MVMTAKVLLAAVGSARTGSWCFVGGVSRIYYEHSFSLMRMCADRSRVVCMTISSLLWRVLNTAAVYGCPEYSAMP
jgi:hypothetical protein